MSEGNKAINISEYSFKNHLFRGISEGGVRTTMSLPRLKLCFDVGHGDPSIVEIPTVLLTHGHMDHSSGIPYYLSQRGLRRLPPPDIYCPPEIVDPLNEIMRQWAIIEDYGPEYKLHGLDYDTLYPLQAKIFFKAIRSVHRVPSNGYVILEKTTKLKAEFVDLPGTEIARLKQERDDLFYESEVPMVTFSGDTQIEFVLENEIVRQSKVLFLECTYISDDRPVSRARHWGHIHLDEIVANAEAFRETEKLYLIHFSPRYRTEAIRAALKAKLPDWLHEKTTPFIFTRGRR